MTEEVRIVHLKTEYREYPLGIDMEAPGFSWQMESERVGAAQSAYRILVWKEEEPEAPVWDSGVILSPQSVQVRYKGQALYPQSRYSWQVSVWDEQKKETKSDTAWFETGLMGTGQKCWNGAEFIGQPGAGVNTAALDTWRYSADFQLEKGNKAGFVLAARNKDNYILFEIDMDTRRLTAYEYCDNAWQGSRETGVRPTVSVLGREADRERGYVISEQAVGNGLEYQMQHIEFIVDKRTVTVTINGECIIGCEEDFLPQNPPNQPRKAFLMSVGFRQIGSRAVYRNIQISNPITGEIYLQEDFRDTSGVFAALGTVKNGRLEIENGFELACPCPGLHLKKQFSLDMASHGGIKSARLYASARGFYEIRINGKRVGEEYLAPGFTDYRIRIPYQTYPAEEYLAEGENNIFIMVGKGYYSGFCGYAGPMIYGRESSFLAQLIIRYKDGTEEIIKTDGTWLYTGKGPLVDSDYLDGETYDARLEEELSLKPENWKPCGVKEWSVPVKPTNGCFKKAPEFELSAQLGQGAAVERILTPAAVWENPKGHFIYDFGQNMVGTIRLKVKAERGVSFKLRYGEMCYKNGEIYIENIRTAANTDIYICKGAKDGEAFIPAFTSHGFRYAEITGNGYTLTDNSQIIGLEGLVLCNAGKKTGAFSCSNPLINQLQSNIEWGQRGNYLLVPTDCPQRNERMGWTGDAQVFAGTAAFNMDVCAFTRKWLQDLRDSQLLYNKEGAVPDTAPLGGDNRADGCAGWADAAVIVPWQMYLEYGDKTILEENYEMMKKWIACQSMDSRQNYGLRTVNGKELPEKSDLASSPFLQVQQRRGDHLAFDESTPFILSATAYAAYAAERMGKIAELLGKEEDARKYRKRFADIRCAFQEAWVKKDGTLGYWGEMSKSNTDSNGNIICETYYSNEKGNPNHPSQTAYALAIDFHLIPEEKLSGAAEGLLQAIKDRDSHISVGFLGISHINPALSRAGLSSEAFALLEQEENPGWLYSVKNGATTIWERWNSYNAQTDTFGDVSMNSFNHYSYGAVGEWMYREILGIQTSEEPGEQAYKRMILKPTVGGGLTFAKGYHDSAYGRISSAWEIREEPGAGRQFSYECRIPANTTAQVILPAGCEAAENTGIIKSRKEGEAVIFEVTSGRYRFTAQLGKVLI